MAAGRFRQLRLLLWKNWLFSLRSWKSTLLQLFAPCFFLVLVTALSYLPQGLKDIPDPIPTAIGPLPKCTGWNGKNCTSLLVLNAEVITQFPNFAPEDDLDTTKIKVAATLVTLKACCIGCLTSRVCAPGLHCTVWPVRFRMAVASWTHSLVMCSYFGVTFMKN